MDYQKWVLEKLIEKYERSKAFTDTAVRRKVGLRVQSEKELVPRLEAAEQKEQFLEALRTLKRAGVIDYSWVKYEQGNLVDRVWLVLEEGMIRQAYERSGRTSKQGRIDRLLLLILRYEEKVRQKGDIYHFLEEMEVILKDSHRIPRFFFEDEMLNEDLLKCLVYMSDNTDEIQVRVLSVSLYRDSKHLERSVMAKVLSILRWLKRQEEEELPSDEELLWERGVVKWPEILEFTGNISVKLTDESVIDYGPHRYGAYINSDTVKQVEAVDLSQIRRIIWIENKANYIWYCGHEKGAKELVLYHGGCYSPVKGIWFQKIYEAGKCKQCVHWSDIDVGGFRIFTRLKKNIAATLQPYRMDRETLLAYQDCGMPISSSAYCKELERLRGEADYAVFWDVIDEMLRLGIRLEQEHLASRP